MSYTKIFIALIAVVSFSVAQQDSTSKKYNSTQPKIVVVAESSKTPNNNATLTDKPKTTWTKIKDLFM